MGERYAPTLLNKKLTQQASFKDATGLAFNLEYKPLAIEQAAAYINQNAPRCTIRQYIERLPKSDPSRTALWYYGAEHERGEPKITNPILSTLKVSIEHLYTYKPSAVNLLSSMSSYNQEAIPRTLLQTQSKMGLDDEALRECDAQPDSDLSTFGWDGTNDAKDQGSESQADEELEEDIMILRDYALISMSEDGITFAMHQAVQLATKDWFEKQGHSER